MDSVICYLSFQRAFKLRHYLLPYSMVQSPFEKLTCLQLVKKFPAFYGTRRFINALTSVRHLSLPWPRPIQSTHLRLGLPKWSLSLRFPHKDPIHPLSSPIRATCPAFSFFSILSPAQYWVWSTDHSAPRYAVSSITPLPRPS